MSAPKRPTEEQVRDARERFERQLRDAGNPPEEAKRIAREAAERHRQREE